MERFHIPQKHKFVQAMHILIANLCKDAQICEKMEWTSSRIPAVHKFVHAVHTFLSELIP